MHSPDLIRYNESASSPSRTMVSLGAYFSTSSTSPRASRCASVRDERRLTACKNFAVVSSASLAAAIRMPRKECWSSAQHALSEVATTEAARGLLYMSASSPNMPPTAYIFTDLSLACCR